MKKRTVMCVAVGLVVASTLAGLAAGWDPTTGYKGTAKVVGIGDGYSKLFIKLTPFPVTATESNDMTATTSYPLAEGVEIWATLDKKMNTNRTVAATMSAIVADHAVECRIWNVNSNVNGVATGMCDVLILEAF